MLTRPDQSDDEDELVYVAASGAGADSVIGMRIGVSQGIAGWVMQSGQPVAVSDLRRDIRFARDVAEDTGYVPQAILAVPVTGTSSQLGVLTLLDRDASRDGAQFDLRTAALFADQAALAIETSRAAADVGGILLRALATAAEDGSSLRAALATAQPRPQRHRPHRRRRPAGRAGRPITGRRPTGHARATRIPRPAMSAARVDQ